MSGVARRPRGGPAGLGAALALEPGRRRRARLRAVRPRGRPLPLDRAVGRAGRARRPPARAGRPDHRPPLDRADRRRLRPRAPAHVGAARRSPLRVPVQAGRRGSAGRRRAPGRDGARRGRRRASAGRPREPDDFESWAVGRYGRAAFSTLLDGYTDKLFGLAAADVDVAFAHSLVGAPKVASASTDVCRPTGGAGALLDAIAAEVERCGGTVRCGTEIARLAVEGSAGGRCRARRRLARALRPRGVHPAPAAARRAPARRTGTAGRPALGPPEPGGRARLPAGAGRARFPEQWVYVFGRRHRVGRVTNYGSFRPGRSRGPDHRVGRAVVRPRGRRRGPRPTTT